MEKNREKKLRVEVRAGGVEIPEKAGALPLPSLTCTLDVPLICAHGCVFSSQPGVSNVLDMGLEKPNNFSSRVTMVSDTSTHSSEIRTQINV